MFDENQDLLVKALKSKNKIIMDIKGQIQEWNICYRELQNGQIIVGSIEANNYMYIYDEESSYIYLNKYIDFYCELNFVNMNMRIYLPIDGEITGDFSRCDDEQYTIAEFESMDLF